MVEKSRVFQEKGLVLHSSNDFCKLLFEPHHNTIGLETPEGYPDTDGKFGLGRPNGGNGSVPKMLSSKVSVFVQALTEH